MAPKIITTGFETSTVKKEIRSGNIKDLLLPVICCVGFIGSGRFKSSAMGKITATYNRYNNMIHRCYSEKDEHYSYYGGKGVKVSEDWHNFQNFADWYYKECEKLNLDPENNNYQLDKDLNSTGSSAKMYSIDNCKLITRQENVEAAWARNYVIISPSGERICFYNMAKFCRDNELTRPNLNKVLNGDRRHHKGWRKA